MNAYFCNVDTELTKKITLPSNEIIRMPQQNPISIFLNQTNYLEVANIIEDMYMKCGGVDNISTKTIKIVSRHIIDLLVHICNLSIEKGIWPDVK